MRKHTPELVFVFKRCVINRCATTLFEEKNNLIGCKMRFLSLFTNKYIAKYHKYVPSWCIEHANPKSRVIVLGCFVEQGCTLHLAIIYYSFPIKGCFVISKQQMKTPVGKRKCLPNICRHSAVESALVLGTRGREFEPPC